MPKLHLSMACCGYDRTRPLIEGRIPIDGIDLTCLELPVEEVFFRMVRHNEFDIAELSLSSYVLSLFSEQPSFVAIPVFPSRFLRHSSVYINQSSGIREPNDLVGKRVGMPEYQLTACVWIRGILSDEYAVPVNSVSYFTGGLEQSGRPEKLALSLPPDIRVQPIPTNKTLAALLDAGEIDALYTPAMPSTFRTGSRKVKRLFENYQAIERDFFLKTRVFPIMHTVVIGREVYEKHPWVAQSLCKAFALAQREAYDDLYSTSALKFMLPWLTRHVEDTRALMGQDFWPYGLEPNVCVLETFLRYHYEQGLSKRLLAPREIFAPEALESFKI